MVNKLQKGCWTASPRTVSQQKRGVYGVAEDYKQWGENAVFSRKCSSPRIEVHKFGQTDAVKK